MTGGILESSVLVSAPESAQPIEAPTKQIPEQRPEERNVSLRELLGPRPTECHDEGASTDSTESCRTNIDSEEKTTQEPATMSEHGPESLSINDPVQIDKKELRAEQPLESPASVSVKKEINTKIDAEPQGTSNENPGGFSGGTGPTESSNKKTPPRQVSWTTDSGRETAGVTPSRARSAAPQSTAIITGSHARVNILSSLRRLMMKKSKSFRHSFKKKRANLLAKSQNFRNSFKKKNRRGSPSSVPPSDTSPLATVDTQQLQNSVDHISTANKKSESIGNLNQEQPPASETLPTTATTPITTTTPATDATHTTPVLPAIENTEQPKTPSKTTTITSTLPAVPTSVLKDREQSLKLLEERRAHMKRSKSLRDLAPRPNLGRGDSLRRQLTRGMSLQREKFPSPLGIEKPVGSIGKTVEEDESLRDSRLPTRGLLSVPTENRRSFRERIGMKLPSKRNLMKPPSNRSLMKLPSNRSLPLNRSKKNILGNASVAEPKEDPPQEEPTTPAKQSDEATCAELIGGKKGGKVSFDVTFNRTHPRPLDLILDATTKSELWWSKEDFQTRRMTDRTLPKADKTAYTYLLHSHSLCQQKRQLKRAQGSFEHLKDEPDLQNDKIQLLINNVTSGINEGHRGLEVWMPVPGKKRRDRVKSVVKSTVMSSHVWNDQGEMLQQHSEQLTAHCRAVARRWGYADALAAWNDDEEGCGDLNGES